MSRLFCELPRFSVRAVMFLKTLCVLLVFVFVTAKAQFVIVRGFRDVFRNLTACSDTNVDFCYEMHAESSANDNCICRCKLLYPMFRNPDVYPSGGKYVSKKKAGCVWYANHRHECFHIRKRESDMGGDGALEFDFSKPGNVTMHSDYDIQSCSRLEAGIKFPDDSDFTIVNNLVVAVRLEVDLVKILWSVAHKGYDGALVRGVFRDCVDTIRTADRCFVAKITGVYNDNCTVRTASGECCIFPFTYKDKVYNNCTTVDNAEPWCAVRLRFNDETNWWGKCQSNENVESQTTTGLNILPSTPISNILPLKTHDIPTKSSVKGKISTHGTTNDSSALLISPNLRPSLSRKGISSMMTSPTSTLGKVQATIAVNSAIKTRGSYSEKATVAIINYTTPILRSLYSRPSGKNETTSTLFSALLNNATRGTVQTVAQSLGGNFTASNKYDMTGSIAKPNASRTEASSVGGTMSVEPTKPDGNVQARRADIGFVLLILAVVGGVTFLIILLVSCVVLCFWNKKKKVHNLPKRRYRSFEMIDSHFRRPGVLPSAHHDEAAGTSQTSVLNNEANTTKPDDIDNEIEFTIPEQDFDSEEGAKKNGQKNPSYITFKL